jgi:hypothetical protein
MSVKQSRLPFKIEADRRPASLTSYAGLPLFVETARALGLPRLIERCLGAWFRGTRYGAVDLAMAILAAIAAGAKSPADVAAMSQDKGLHALLGVKHWPSESAILRFLYAFHELPTWRGGEKGRAVVPAESGPLRALYRIQHGLLDALQEREAQRIATLDIDATIIESSKREALPHYDGGTGYQPCITLWVEMGIVIRDHFRDGNVPAAMAPLAQIKRAVRSLPTGVEKVFLRSDSALYSPKALVWMDRRGITFAITADMTTALRAAIAALPASAWSRLRKLNPFGGLVPTDLEIAEVEFTPESMCVSKRGRPFRFIVARRVEDQGQLFGSSGPTRDEQGRRWHLALVTNNWDDSTEAVWNWSRERCGSVERTHDEIKNDLAAGVMPCGRFQANAAWFRLNVLAYNVLSAMKLVALPAHMRSWRPATLRFRLLNLAGRVVHHARELVLKLPWIENLVDIYREARKRLWPPRRARAAPAAAG